MKFPETDDFDPVSAVRVKEIVTEATTPRALHDNVESLHLGI